MIIVWEVSNLTFMILTNIAFSFVYIDCQVIASPPKRIYNIINSAGII